MQCLKMTTKDHVHKSRGEKFQEKLFFFTHLHYQLNSSVKKGSYAI